MRAKGVGREAVTGDGVATLSPREDAGVTSMPSADTRASLLGVSAGARGGWCWVGVQGVEVEAPPVVVETPLRRRACPGVAGGLGEGSRDGDRRLEMPDARHDPRATNTERKEDSGGGDCRGGCRARSSARDAPTLQGGAVMVTGDGVGRWDIGASSLLPPPSPPPLSPPPWARFRERYANLARNALTPPVPFPPRCCRRHCCCSRCSFVVSNSTGENRSTARGGAAEGART